MRITAYGRSGIEAGIFLTFLISLPRKSCRFVAAAKLPSSSWEIATGPGLNPLICTVCFSPVRFASHTTGPAVSRYATLVTFVGSATIGGDLLLARSTGQCRR